VTTYRLLQSELPVPPVLDASQQAVVDHPGGPLLVLAGPGTGKTTTMVEAIVARVARGTSPDRILALTFSRKAAEQLREKVTARLGMTTSGSMAATFHSFAYSLVRAYAPAELYLAPLRLLSAPEQDVVIQELLGDHPEAVTWPAGLRAAVSTRGFAREVQKVIGRARERGLDPEDLIALGRAENVPEFEAAGHFLEQYLDVLGAQAVIDYPDLMARAVIEAGRHRTELRARYDCVLIDEYQDTDPSQVALVQELAGDGRDLIVVGDPDQSIYGFRGADVSGILGFPRTFPTTAGEPAPVIALGTTRRFGPNLLLASRRIASGIAVRGSIPAAAYETFRNPTSASDDAGRVDVLTFDTSRAEVEHIADLLRRAHLDEAIPWSEMAVLVRSGRSSIPGLRRALAAAGVPVEVASDEVPLTQEPAVRVLLDALEHILDPDPPRDRVEELLVSPLGALDATDVRVVTRALRAAHPDIATRDLISRAVTEPALLEGLEIEPIERTRRLAALLATARAQVAGSVSAEHVLWTLWSGTPWPERLRVASLGSGTASRYAHRDLDALCALFELAAKIEEQRDHTSVAAFLATLRAQEIPADTLAERGVRGESVRLLTAHRSKGLEWQLVVVAGVQEGAWPDLRRRDSLLGADRIGGPRAGLLPALTRASMLAEERRLFYVAATRARSRLVVTAVQSPDDDGEQPSRFLAELGRRVEHRVGRPRRPMSLVGVVADLRRTVADPDQPDELRDAAAVRLRQLAELTVNGRPVVPAADPTTWWGTRRVSRSRTPVRPADRPVSLSASALDNILECPAQWFLSREAGGQSLSSASQGFGKIVHTLAERVATGELADASVDDLMIFVDEVWDRMEFRTPWSRDREYAAVRDALGRYLAWHRRANARPVLGLEQHIRTPATLPSGDTVELNGYADRLELDADGNVIVVDLKTGKYLPSAPQVAAHVQLGLYQLAVDNGAVVDAAGRPVRAGGAELVQLRHGDADMPVVQRQDTLPAELTAQIQEAVDAIRTEMFPARPERQRCRRCDFKSVCPAETTGSVLS
jgi:superfamily I DNA/RNA helicase/RecB family exonuclease